MLSLNKYSIAISIVSGAVATLNIASPVLAAIIADSVSEFSGTQGQNNWYYGYYDGSLTSADFKQMTQYEDGWWWNQKGTYWTCLWNTGQHPNGNPTSGERKPVPQWAVRRWVGETDGKVTISGKLAATNPSANGDGFIGKILVDDVPIFSQYIPDADLTGVNYSVNATVKKGSFVDFVIAPNGNDWGDGATFTTTISVD